LAKAKYHSSFKNIKNAPAIMVVGGWYDAEDLYDL
jgi:hypothetical protein